MTAPRRLVLPSTPTRFARAVTGGFPGATTRKAPDSMTTPPAASTQHYLGVEVSGTTLRAALVSAGGEVLGRREAALERDGVAAQVARLVAELRESLKARAPSSVSASDVPGLVNPATGHVVISTDLPALVRGDLRTELEKATGLRRAAGERRQRGRLRRVRRRRGPRQPPHVLRHHRPRHRRRASSSTARSGAGPRASPASSATSPSTPRASSAPAATSAVWRRWPRPPTSSAARTTDSSATTPLRSRASP